MYPEKSTHGHELSAFDYAFAAAFTYSHHYYTTVSHKRNCQLWARLWRRAGCPYFKGGVVPK